MKNQPVSSSHDESYKDEFEDNHENLDDLEPPKPLVKLVDQKKSDLGGLNAIPTLDVGNSNRRQTLAEKVKPKPPAAAGRFDYLNFGKDGSEKSMTSR